MSAWSNLPNAKHIDRVLASVKKHPEIWVEAHGAARDAVMEAARDAVMEAARGAARNTVWDATRDAAYDATRNATRSAAWYAAYRAARNAAWDAILALLAYEDCEQYLSMPSEQLRMWATLTEQPAAILLLPAVIAFERNKKLESV